MSYMAFVDAGAIAAGPHQRSGRVRGLVQLTELKLCHAVASLKGQETQLAATSTAIVKINETAYREGTGHHQPQLTRTTFYRSLLPATPELVRGKGEYSAMGKCPHTTQVSTSVVIRLPSLIPAGPFEVRFALAEAFLFLSISTCTAPPWLAAIV